MDELEALDEACAGVQAARSALDGARTARNEALQAAFAAGVSIPALVERSGLGRSRVQELLGHPYGSVGPPSRSAHAAVRRPKR